MDTEVIVSHLDRALARRTGQRLNQLQRLILHQVYQGQKYREIADDAGYTEGHIKDVGSDLWKLLSNAFGTKFTKSNCKAMIKRSLQSAGLYHPDQFIPPVGSSYRSNAAPEVSPLTWGELNATSPQQQREALLGRTAAIQHLTQLTQQGHPIIVLQGAGGLGKTTLAQHFLHHQSFDVVLELFIAKEIDHLTSADRVVAEWLKQDFATEPSIDFSVSLSRLKRHLQKQRVGILIDNLETALDARGKFLNPQRQYLELLRVLSLPNTQSQTIITSRDRLCEVDANLVHYRLPGLSSAAWTQFFQAAGNSVDQQIIDSLCQTYGGNAKAMGIISGIVQTDFDRDLLAYWQTPQATASLEPDLAQLILSQIQRLQSLDQAAYHLLCRLSCYRYQSIPQLSYQALCAMLWDIDKEKRALVIQSLQQRSLIETHQGQYWLHPAVKQVALNLLLQSQSAWQTSQRAAANFWTQSISSIHTQQDALSAFEAYHHYMAIRDYHNAADTILRSRHNQWQQYLPLGSTLYRMGFTSMVLEAINSVIPHLENQIGVASLELAELHNILGDLYWIGGAVSAAINCQKSTINTVQSVFETTATKQINSHQDYYLNMLRVDAELSLGLYHIDLWEIDTAGIWFEQVIQRAANTSHDRWAQKARICLAYVHSIQGHVEVAHKLLEAITFTPQTTHHQTGSHAYFLQLLGQAHAQLGNTKTAEKFYAQTLLAAQTGEYPQIKARTLRSMAELHRQAGETDYALSLQQEAITLLEQIGAQCDLAETHLQMGYGYQDLEHHESAQKHWKIAQQMFAAIDAPRQLQRVQLAMSTLL